MTRCDISFKQDTDIRGIFSGWDQGVIEQDPIFVEEQYPDRDGSTLPIEADQFVRYYSLRLRKVLDPSNPMITSDAGRDTHRLSSGAAVSSWLGRGEANGDVAAVSAVRLLMGRMVVKQATRQW